MEKLIDIIFWIVGGIITIWGFNTNGPAFFIPWLFICFLLFMGWGMLVGSMANTAEQQKLDAMTSEARERYKEIMAKHREESHKIYLYGGINDALVCPHCQTKGKVRSQYGEEVSKTKVIPVIGNNIKTRRSVTKMHCDNCHTDWSI